MLDLKSWIDSSLTSCGSRAFSDLESENSEDSIRTSKFTATLPDLDCRGGGEGQVPEPQAQLLPELLSVLEEDIGTENSGLKVCCENDEGSEERWF